ncbi:MAG TPA: hypothetical protein VIW03_15800 [Anaeromyxobacter sp.]
MARPPRKVLQKAVEKDMPGYVVARGKAGAGPRGTKSDAVSPELDALRRKYLGDDAGAAGQTAAAPPPAADAGGAPDAGDDDAIVTVEPKDRSRDGRLPGGRRAKRVVVSKAGKVIGRQG